MALSTWTNKNVIICGGSAGFGLNLAETYGAQGASVILVARNAGRLRTAHDYLQNKRIKVQTFVADATSDQDIEALGKFITTELGGKLDVLVNATGKSDRGRAVATTVEEFQSLWDTNFLSAVRCTKTLLPNIQASQGSIVNIGSLASKTAGLYLGGYPAAKHALAAYSQQLRLELAEKGVHVLLVCPGPIRRDDAGDRYADAAKDLPESAMKPGGSKLKGLDAQVLAKQVVSACERRSPELVVPRKARLLFAISQLWPSLGDRILRKMTS